MGEVYWGRLQKKQLLGVGFGVKRSACCATVAAQTAGAGVDVPSAEAAAGKTSADNASREEARAAIFAFFIGSLPFAK